MKKIIFLLAFSLIAVPLFADQQINEGQDKSTAAVKFTTVRYGRTGAVATAGGNALSKDMVVIWDAVSKDGVSVLTSTTSYDKLGAGILMDAIPGSSRDNSVANDLGYPNFGRMQTWGFHDNALSSGNITAGDALCVGGSAGRVFSCTAVLAVAGGLNTSADLTAVGVALETVAGASQSTVDMFVKAD